MRGKRGQLTDAFLKLKNAPRVLNLFLRLSISGIVTFAEENR
jgi:hypothetical protein